MARKSPFRNVRVGTHILEALEGLMAEENRKVFRPLTMNAFCEKILWDYATGKISHKDVIQPIEMMVRDKKREKDQEG